MTSMNTPQVKPRSYDLLYVTIIASALILWTVGFFDLIEHTSKSKTIFNRYSASFFVVLLLYGLGYLVWGGLLIKPAFLQLPRQIITYIQQRNWLSFLVLILLVGSMWAVLSTTRLSSLPRLKLSIAGLLLLAAMVLIFTNWFGANAHRWRKVLGMGVLTLISAELILQALAAFTLLPGSYNIAGLFIPHGRVYSTAEGLGTGSTNNYGWYYPDFRLEEGTKRVLLLGDSYLQALQIDPSENVGVILEDLINQNQTEQTEVIALGMPGFGPGLYLSLTRLDHAIEVFKPDEIIVFFNLGSDFQTATQPTGYNLYFVLEEGNAIIHDDNFDYQHDLKHLILDGYEPDSSLADTLWSNYLTAQIGQQISGNRSRNSDPEISGDEFDVPGYSGVVYETKKIDATHNAITSFDLVKTPGKNNFVYEEDRSARAEESLAIANSLIKISHDFAKAKGVTLRVVTIPVFPEAFYTQNDNDAWNSTLGDYDLFLPEVELQDFTQAKNISFLAASQHLHQTGASVNEIKNLYLLDGLGHFSPAGHKYFAQMVYDCFFDEGQLTTEVGGIKVANQTATSPLCYLGVGE